MTHDISPARGFNLILTHLSIRNAGVTVGSFYKHPGPGLRVIVQNVQKPCVGVSATLAGFLQKLESKGVSAWQPVGKIPEK
jgi:hypothetical protein